MNFDVCCLHHLPTLPVLGLIRCGSGGAAIILIMTRWHEDDLASRLLAEADPTRGLDCGYTPLLTPHHPGRLGLSI